jgi:hypothetical protein
VVGVDCLQLGLAFPEPFWREVFSENNNK